jgi:transposase
VSLTDAQWARIEPLLPDRALKRGGRWRDQRQVIDAIAFAQEETDRLFVFRARSPSSYTLLDASPPTVHEIVR